MKKNYILFLILALFESSLLYCMELEIETPREKGAEEIIEEQPQRVSGTSDLKSLAAKAYAKRLYKESEETGSPLIQRIMLLAQKIPSDIISLIIHEIIDQQDEEGHKYGKYTNEMDVLADPLFDAFINEPSAKTNIVSFMDMLTPGNLANFYEWLIKKFYPHAKDEPHISNFIPNERQAAAMKLFNELFDEDLKKGKISYVVLEAILMGLKTCGANAAEEPISDILLKIKNHFVEKVCEDNLQNESTAELNEDLQLKSKKFEEVLRSYLDFPSDSTMEDLKNYASSLGKNLDAILLNVLLNLIAENFENYTTDSDEDTDSEDEDALNLEDIETIMAILYPNDEAMLDTNDEAMLVIKNWLKSFQDKYPSYKQLLEISDWVIEDIDISSCKDFQLFRLMQNLQEILVNKINQLLLNILEKGIAKTSESNEKDIQKIENILTQYQELGSDFLAKVIDELESEIINNEERFDHIQMMSAFKLLKKGLLRYDSHRTDKWAFTTTYLHIDIFSQLEKLADLFVAELEDITINQESNLRDNTLLKMAQRMVRDREHYGDHFTNRMVKLMVSKLSGTTSELKILYNLLRVLQLMLALEVGGTTELDNLSIYENIDDVMSSISVYQDIKRRIGELESVDELPTV